MIGLTGPPGVGKSTLASALVRAWRAAGRTVGVIAVDPSSRRTRGALLGDRTRIDVDPDDQGVFVRSMAARDRLGGLADLCAAAMVLMRAVYDVVLIETVGVGQSETEVTDLADTVVFAAQPGSGDSLQFIKAGIVEIPDIALVTKADMGGIAERAQRDLEGALGLGSVGIEGWKTPILLVSATSGQGIDAVLERSPPCGVLAYPGDRRARQARAWLERWVREEFGRRGAARARTISRASLPMARSPRSAGSPGPSRNWRDSAQDRQRQPPGGAGVSTESPAISGSAAGASCSSRSSARAMPPTPERSSPASRPPRVIGVPGRGQGALDPHRHQPLLHQPAMLGARGQLLADEAALGEADPVQLLEAALQQERFVDDQVAAAVGHAQRQPVAVVGGEWATSCQAIRGDEGVDLARGSTTRTPSSARRGSTASSASPSATASGGDRPRPRRRTRPARPVGRRHLRSPPAPAAGTWSGVGSASADASARRRAGWSRPGRTGRIEQVLALRVSAGRHRWRGSGVSKSTSLLIRPCSRSARPAPLRRTMPRWSSSEQRGGGMGACVPAGSCAALACG